MDNTQGVLLTNPNPLSIHFALRARGSSFADIARQSSKQARKRIAAFQVRGVVYGYTSKHASLIWSVIANVLNEPTTLDIAAAISVPTISVRASAQPDKDKTSLGLEAA